MSDTPTAIPMNGKVVGDLEAPDVMDVQGDLAKVFAQYGTRTFEPDKSRAETSTDVGAPPGGPVAVMGNEPMELPFGGFPGAATVDASQHVDVATSGDVEDAAPTGDGQPGSSDGSGEQGEPATLAPPDPATRTDAPEPAEQQETSTQSDDQQLPPPEPPSLSEGWTTELNGQTLTFTNEQVLQGLQLLSWATELPEHTRMAMAQIQEGQAVAVPRAEYDRYQAWLNQQQTAQRDADLTHMDEDVAAAIKAARDEADSLRAQIAQMQQGTAAAVPPNIDRNLTGVAEQYDAACREFQQQHGLTEQELTTLMDSVVRSQIIVGLQQSHTQFNPITGQVVHMDGKGAMRKALQSALTWHPEIHNAVLQRQVASTGASQDSTQPAKQTTDPVTRKKANAASLAAAPSAAVPTNPRERPLTGQAAVMAMAEEIHTILNS